VDIALPARFVKRIRRRLAPAVMGGQFLAQARSA
jgi:hypothetical protein